MKRGKIILILVLMSISISILVYSFAYTTTTHTGDDSSYLMVSEITFGLNDSVESINLEQQTPTIDKFGVLNKSFSFSITNTSNNDLPYTVRLIDKDVISTIPNEEIRYQLTVNGNVQEIQNLSNGGALDSGSIAKGDIIEYSLIVWLDYDTDVTGGVWEKVATVEAGTVNIDKSGANHPILLDNMIPVYYDVKEDVWRKADRTNSNSNHQWYDYDARMWANAVTINDNGTYEEKVTTNQTVNIENSNSYVSGNFNVHNSTSEMSLKVSSTIQGAVFKLDYSVSSESRYDKLTIMVGDTVVVNGISGESSGAYNLTLDANQEYKIVIKYVKDSSTHKLDDKAYVSFSKVDGVTVQFSSLGNYPWKIGNVIGSSYDFDISTGKYTLKSTENSVISSDWIGKYICDDLSKSVCNNMYKVNQANTSITNIDLYTTNVDLIRDAYINASSGEPILMDNISSFYVWIPRFKYDLFASGSPKIINVTFENGIESTGTMKCMRNGTSNVCSGESLSYTHPAFTFGEEELTGYWINKFELSPEPSTTCYSNVISTNCNINDLAIVSKPNLKSLTSISIGNLFYSVRNMELNNNIYGFKDGGAILNGDGSIDGDDNNYDIHLSRNFESAALAYLTYSKYGKYSNTLYKTEVDKQLFINNSNTKTGSSYVDSKTYEYNVEYYGVGASTTGNIYGVYDLNGQVYDYVMANLVISDEFNQLNPSNSSFVDSPILKYYDAFVYSNDYGMGVKEFNGFTDNVSSTPTRDGYPFVARKTVDSVSNSIGGDSYRYSGRAVITIDQDIYITKW